jgi:hypothetical protein
MLIFLMLSFSGGIVAQERVKAIERFSSGSATDDGINGWKERSFVGNTDYTIVNEDGNYVLRAFADSSASGLYKDVKYDLKECPWLSWRWKVDRLPDKGDVYSKETDDYGARVYVIFPHFLRWRTKTISYIWARRLPKGEHVPNAWLPDNAVMVSVQSGPDSLGQWITEQRNVFQDYKNIFGKEPPKAGAIALMSDGDNTGGIAEAYYDDFILMRNHGNR